MKRLTYYQKLLFDEINVWRRFVIQKHHATRLHYDFRIEHDGVLKSWAVPDGPCLDPVQRRSAILVNDHEIDYGQFEGTIPAGLPGAGPVMLWDVGSWRTEENVQQSLCDGRLNFQLRGRKLNGRWSLIRVSSWRGKKGEKWILKKEHDSEAQSLSKLDILKEQPFSIVTGRNLAEIASDSPPFRPVKSKLNANQSSLFSDDHDT